jgi:hypothetical protein
MNESKTAQFAVPAFWKRALYMVLFAIAYSLAELVLGVVVLVQFFTVGFTGRANEPLLRLSNNLAAYVRQIYRFLAYNDETMPFPMGEWPDEPAEGAVWRQDAEPVATQSTGPTSTGPETDSVGSSG